nr:KUP/HAK/KT family potassium transporter [Angustibacter aerolatus]
MVEGEQAPGPVERPGPPHAVRTGLVLAALGVVFGDIGTSPLYALETVFSIDGGAVRPTPGDVYGVVSLMFWSVTLIVSVKYVGVVMRADNEGEGGVLALAALARRLYSQRGGRSGALLLVGVVGVSLFYGDSLITPAISVLSAVEGLEVAAPSLSHVVLPIAVVIVVLLFAGQRFGTGRVGRLFGPVTVLWLLALAAGGVWRAASEPQVLKALSPTYGAAFVVAHPGIAFVAMGAIVLVITGAEALYADMGHFGRQPILRAWFFLVFPALTLNYLGQAALILDHPGAEHDPFFLLYPEWARLPVVVLATAATVIASQAVISGAFSLTRQAMQARAAATADGQADLRAGGRPDLPAGSQRAAARRGAGAPARLPVVGAAGDGVRRLGDRRPGRRHRAAAAGRTRAVGLAAVEAWPSRPWRSASSRWCSSRRTCRRWPTAAGCRCSSRRPCSW